MRWLFRILVCAILEWGTLGNLIRIFGVANNFIASPLMIITVLVNISHIQNYSYEVLQAIKICVNNGFATDCRNVDRDVFLYDQDFEHTRGDASFQVITVFLFCFCFSIGLH